MSAASLLEIPIMGEGMVQEGAGKELNCTHNLANNCSVLLEYYGASTC